MVLKKSQIYDELIRIINLVNSNGEVLNIILDIWPLDSSKLIKLLGESLNRTIILEDGLIKELNENEVGYNYYRILCRLFRTTTLVYNETSIEPFLLLDGDEISIFKYKLDYCWSNLRDEMIYYINTSADELISTRIRMNSKSIRSESNQKRYDNVKKLLVIDNLIDNM